MLDIKTTPLNTWKRPRMLPGVSQIENRVEPSKFTLGFWWLISVLFNQVTLFITSLVLFITTALLATTVTRLQSESFLRGSLAGDVLSVIVPICQIGAFILILIQAVASKRESLTNSDNKTKRDRFIGVLGAILLAFALSNLVVKVDNLFSLKSVGGIGVLAATLAMLATGRETEVTGFKKPWLTVGLSLILVTYLLVIALPQQLLFVFSVPLCFLGLMSTALVFNSLPRLKGSSKVIKYFFSWLLALTIVIAAVYYSNAEVLAQEKLKSYPQNLQYIVKVTDKFQDLPQPEIKGQAIKGYLEQNQVEVLIVPYNFYKKARREETSLIPLTKRYEAVFIYPSERTSWQKQIEGKDILDLPGEKVHLQFIFDNNGPLLNSGSSQTVLVISDQDFHAMQLKQKEPLLEIGLWQDALLATQAEKMLQTAREKGLELNVSSNQDLINKIVSTKKITWLLVAVAVMTLFLFLSSVAILNRLTEGKKQLGGAIALLGLSLLEASAMINTYAKFMNLTTWPSLLIGSVGFLLALWGLIWLDVRIKRLKVN